MKHAFKHKKHDTPSARPAAPPVAGSSSTRWKLLGLVLVLSAGITWAGMEFVIWNTLPGELVGKWVVQDGEQEGATFDFYRNGAMVAQINNRGMADIVHAQVTVEDNILSMTSFHPTKGAITRKHTITLLTADRLVIRDEQQNVYRMERAEPPGLIDRLASRVRLH